MKRRLTRAYDHMTMPDRCSNTIERKLMAELESRKTGRSIRTMAPEPVRRHGWTLGVAAVCLMLVLSVGGTMLFLNTGQSMTRQQTETIARFAEPETVETATPESHYQVATSFSVETVESFAKVVRSNILKENWNALADKIQYPITLEGKKISGKSEFVDLMEDITIGSHFRLGMEYESCMGMSCGPDGIFMGDGLIQIQQTWQYQLKITAINSLTAAAEDISWYIFMQSADGTVAIQQYRGYEEEAAFPNVSGNAFVREIGTGRPVILHGDVVKIVYLQQTVSKVADYAFANCPALEAVYFEGDAPAQAEGVFDGSENVVVYYQEGTKGWGDTWCGRKTQSCVVTNIYLGAATVQIDQQTANAAYLDVLHGKGTFWCDEFEADLTIEEYCQMRSGTEGTAVDVPYFALVDMDWDALKELVFWVSLEDDGAEDYLILRYSENGGGMVYCYMEPRRKMTDLRKDGSFYWQGNDCGGPGWVILDNKNENRYVRDESITEKPMVDWHVWPCVRPEIVVQSYEYAGTGQTLLPGNAYYTFEGLAMGTTDNDWNRLKEDLTAMGMICLEDEGTVSVFDPDAPGTCLYGTLTNANGMLQLADVGYYICTEEKEYAAEIRNLLSANPEYWVDVHLPFFMGTFGRMVSTPEELLAYLP